MENDKQRSDDLDSKKAPEESISDSELDTVVGGVGMSGPAGLSSELTAVCITD